MGKFKEVHKTEYDFDQLLQDSFGLNDAHILEGMRRAQQEIPDSQLPPTPADDYERLLEKVVQLKIEPYSDKTAVEVEPKKESLKSRCLKTTFRVALAFGVLLTMMVFTSITAGAKKSFHYKRKVRSDVKKEIVLNNDENMQQEGKLEEVYNEIHEMIGINVLRLNYKPTNMKYIESAISKNRATMYFDYRGKRFYFTQQLRTDNNSLTIVSDRENSDTVFNEWLGKEIEIEKATTESGEIEYSAQIIEGSAYYYLSGIMDKSDFQRILEDLTFFE